MLLRLGPQHRHEVDVLARRQPRIVRMIGTQAEFGGAAQLLLLAKGPTGIATAPAAHFVESALLSCKWRGDGSLLGGGRIEQLIDFTVRRALSAVQHGLIRQQRRHVHIGDGGRSGRHDRHQRIRVRRIGGYARRNN
jgi:hypothetical protein